MAGSSVSSGKTPFRQHASLYAVTAPAFVDSVATKLVPVGGSRTAGQRKGKWQPPTGLNPEQCQAVIDAAQTLRNRLLLWTLFATGARIGEVVQLRADGLVDGPPAKIRLPLEKNRSRHHNEIALYPEDRPLVFYLRSLAGQSPNQYVFPGRDGGCLTTRAARNVFYVCCDRAGVTLFHAGQERRPWPHIFRHSRVEQDLARGLNLADIQQQRGWARLDSGTAYLRPTPDQIASKMERL